MEKGQKGNIMAKVSDILFFLQEKKFEFEYVGCDYLEIKGFSSLSSYKNNTLTWVKKRDNWEKNVKDILIAVVEEGLDLPLKNIIKCRRALTTSKSSYTVAKC